jgi:hypothetical protein
MIFSKIFFGFWLARKNYKNAKIRVRQMLPESGNVRSPLPDSREKVWPDQVISDRNLLDLALSMARSCKSRPEFGGRHPVSVDGFRRRQDTDDRMLSDSGPVGFRRSTIAKFWQSDIKRACKKEEFNFGKRFTVLKIVNRFLKIKEGYGQTENNFRWPLFSPLPNTVKCRNHFSKIILRRNKRSISVNIWKNYFTRWSMSKSWMDKSSN